MAGLEKIFLRKSADCFAEIKIVRSTLKLLVDEANHEAGNFEIRCDLGDLVSGNYYARLQNGAHQQVVTLVKVR